MLSKKDDTFREFVLDQLGRLNTVAARSMFGGDGLYCEGTFFGIIFKGRLYFKTDPSTRPAYHEHGMKPFRPSAQQTLKNYYEVPVEVIEDPDELINWAGQAILVSHKTG